MKTQALRHEIKFDQFQIAKYNPFPMDIAELTDAMHRFVQEQGWYEPDSPRPQSMRNLAISLVLEATEVLEHFQWNDNLSDQEALGSELADVALYLLQIASIAQIDLERAILNKLQVNYHRTWDSHNLKSTEDRSMG